MFRVSGKVQGGLMQERWFPGIWLGRELHTSENRVMKEDGLVVRSRAVREVSENTLLSDLDKLQSTPHATPGEDGDTNAPRRVKITRSVVERLGPSRACQKCRAVFKLLEVEGQVLCNESEISKENELHEEDDLMAKASDWGVLEEADEITCEALDPQKVVRGRENEFGKLKEREVYSYVSREEALNDPTGKFVKTRWVQTNKGEEVRCRFVARNSRGGTLGRTSSRGLHRCSQPALLSAGWRQSRIEGLG